MRELHNPEPGPDCDRAFKVFGLQGTGTNLVRRLLLQNYDVATVEIGSEWKHGRVENPRRRWQGNPVFFIVCVRHPLSWLGSCYRHFCRARRDPMIPKDFDPAMPFGEFLRFPVYGFADSVERWNVMNRHWVTALPADRRVVVRHEDMREPEDQISVLHDIGERFDLVPRQLTRGTASRIMPGMSPAQVRGRVRYALRESEYTAAQASWLRQKAWDDFLLSELGYERTWDPEPSG